MVSSSQTETGRTSSSTFLPSRKLAIPPSWKAPRSATRWWQAGRGKCQPKSFVSPSSVLSVRPSPVGAASCGSPRIKQQSLGSLGGLPRGRRDAIGDHSKNPVEIIPAHELGFKGEGVAHALPMPVDENQRLMAVHQHRVEFVMGVFDLVRHRRMSGQEGTEKPWHPVGWTQNHILSNPLHRSRRVLANCRADPQFSTVRKIRGRSVILTSRPRRSLHRGRFRILDLHPMPARAAPVGAVAVLVPQHRLLACYWFRREGANEAALRRRRESIPTLGGNHPRPLIPVAAAGYFRRRGS